MVVISDDGGNFHKFTRVSGITPDHPYFTVDNSNIFYMVDVPHLVKSTRNNFFKYKLQFGGNETSKKYLQQFYELDIKQKFRLAPKLTNDHIYPNNFKKMKVKLATQVFSSTVAAALSSYISFNIITAQAIHTVDFIEKMDKLFDIFNSSRNMGVKEFNKPFVGNEKQISFLEEMKQLFKSMRVIDEAGKDVTNRIKFIKGWQITISALLGLWPVLKHKGISKVSTRRFNQDCLENFFGKIRQLSGNCRNPTCIQFQRSFKKLFALSFFEHIEGTNCIEDFDEILTSLKPENLKEYEVLVPNTINQYLFLDSNDYTNLQLPEQNSFSYISSYFMKKCLEKHKCDICINYARENELLSAETLYTQFRAYPNAKNDTFGNLQTPNEKFIDYLNILETIFSEHFPNLSIELGVGRSIKHKLQEVPFSHPCLHFPVDYLISLYVRVRIYYTIKFINRSFKTTSKKIKENQKIQNL
ncbi:transposable element P transposase isoform X1 [Leptinotarsa decemlineata]|uniref:transposable element P transposase isoform X1 n=1 Tax=Leptinotarsa decemlineata TaxID=7539 RepID=UPI003D3068FF